MTTKSKKIQVKGIEIVAFNRNHNDYISLTDIARYKNPDKKEGNLRDYAEVTQLVVLANLEGINAELIRRGLPQSERLTQLNEIAIIQMKSLIGNSSIKKLK